jgi:proteasome assembly chaperone (PAC2) family protein
MESWVNMLGDKPSPKESKAIVGSPGLRSIGKLAIDFMISQLKPRLIGELLSHYFPTAYPFSASYVSSPMYLGESGVFIEGTTKVPRIEFHVEEKLGLVLVRGYQADFNGQYEVAREAVKFLKELGVNEIISLAGHGQGGSGVHCAATSTNRLSWLKSQGLDTGYVGPFLGFSGLVVGIGKTEGIDGICLFGKTEPMQEEPEYPDPMAAKTVLDALKRILNLNIDTSSLEKAKSEDISGSVDSRKRNDRRTVR